jgi:hypothetical protein
VTVLQCPVTLVQVPIKDLWIMLFFCEDRVKIFFFNKGPLSTDKRAGEEENMKCGGLYDCTKRWPF